MGYGHPQQQQHYDLHYGAPQHHYGAPHQYNAAPRTKISVNTGGANGGGGGGGGGGGNGRNGRRGSGGGNGGGAAEASEGNGGGSNVRLSFKGARARARLAAAVAEGGVAFSRERGRRLRDDDRIGGVVSPPSSNKLETDDILRAGGSWY